MKELTINSSKPIDDSHQIKGFILQSIYWILQAFLVIALLQDQEILGDMLFSRKAIYIPLSWLFLRCLTFIIYFWTSSNPGFMHLPEESTLAEVNETIN